MKCPICGEENSKFGSRSFTYRTDFRSSVTFINISTYITYPFSHNLNLLFLYKLVVFNNSNCYCFAVTILYHNGTVLSTTKIKKINSKYGILKRHEQAQVDARLW